MAKEKIRIRLKAYDHRLLDQSGEKIVNTAKRAGASVSGPIPLPTERNVFTVLRSPHKFKDAIEKFEMRTHKRLYVILNLTQQMDDLLIRIALISGIELELLIHT